MRFCLDSECKQFISVHVDGHRFVIPANLLQLTASLTPFKCKLMTAVTHRFEQVSRMLKG